MGDSGPSDGPAGIGALAIVGVAWLALSGVCTAAFVLPSLGDPFGGGAIIRMALAIGLPSMGVGLVGFLIGYEAHRRRWLGILTWVGAAWFIVSCAGMALLFLLALSTGAVDDALWKIGLVSIAGGFVVFLIGYGLHFWREEHD